MIDPGLDGKVALITGANQGIGAAIARALAAQGVAVHLAFLRLDPNEHSGDAGIPEQYANARASNAEAVVDRIRHLGGRADSTEADLANVRTPRLLFERAEEAFGPVDILVNNASGWVPDTFLADRTDRLGRRLHAVSADTHDRQFAVDTRAPALLIAEFARRHMNRRGSWGRIVGLTSGAPGGFPEEVSYGAAKAAQENYTMSAALELGSVGVTANMVHPPVTDTGWVTPAVANSVTGPLGTVAQPAEVAEVVVFLTSHQARHITGQVIRMS